MSGCDRRTFLGACASFLAGPAAPRYAAVFVYSQPRVRPRHQDLVQQALELRAAVHTSGWAIGKRQEPRLAIGPVRGNAAQFHEDKLVTLVDKAWPFVIVLEYDADGEPRAHLDWFRRAADSSDPTAWLLDPGIGYAEHINAELVTAQSGRLGMLALADTPTGSYVGSAQWAVRGRVRWQDGSRTQKGWWLELDAPMARRVELWHMTQAPLVDWRVVEEQKERGILATAPVENPDRELAVLGTRTVFRFPEMPPGLTAGRGRR